MLRGKIILANNEFKVILHVSAVMTRIVIFQIIEDFEILATIDEMKPTGDMSITITGSSIEPYELMAVNDLMLNFQKKKTEIVQQN